MKLDDLIKECIRLLSLSGSSLIMVKRGLMAVTIGHQINSNVYKVIVDDYSETLMSPHREYEVLDEPD